MDISELSPSHVVGLVALRKQIHSGLMQISSPRELLASIPHMLGFHPTNSVVVVAFDADEVVAAVRADIEVVRTAMISPLIATLKDIDEAFLAIVYFASSQEATTDWQDELAQLIEHSVLDSLLVTPTHWRSLLCEDVECCPREGHVLDDAATSLDAFLVFNGSAPFRSREELVSSLQPVTRDEGESDAIRQAFAQETSLSAEHEHLGLIEVFASGREPTIEDIARLCVAIDDFHIRDALLRSCYDDPHIRSVLKIALHSHIAIVPESLVAPAATLLAGCAWLDGNGVLANVAVARALEVDPDYSLAQLLDRALTHGVPPHVWAESLAAVSMERCLAGAA